MIIEPRHRDIRPEHLQIASRAQKSHSTVAAGVHISRTRPTASLGFPLELFSGAPEDDDAAAASERGSSKRPRFMSRLNYLVPL